MDDPSAALVSGIIGAAAGLIGGAGAALSAIRSSQLAARVPLAGKVHQLNNAFVRLSAAPPAEFHERVMTFSRAWNDLAVHQKILAPSRRIGALNDLVWHATMSEQLPKQVLIPLAGDALNALTDMIAAQSKHLFRWRAALEERAVGRRFRKKVMNQLPTEGLRQIARQV
jgi:hypothetical protein